MSKELDEATQQYAAGKYKKALDTLRYVEANSRTDPGESGGLLELASDIRESCSPRLRIDCDDLIASAEGILAEGSSPQSIGNELESSQPAAWPLFLYGVAAAGAIAAYAWARSMMSVEHILLTGTYLKPSVGQPLQALCIGTIVGCVIGVIVQVIRLSKAGAVSAATVAVNTASTVPSAPTADEVPERGGTAEALRSLEALKGEGLVTDEEYSVKRAQILARL